MEQLKWTKRIYAELEALFTGLKMPGMSCAVTNDREIIWSHSWGYANKAAMEHIDLHSTFYIASLTKIFTAAVIGQLAEAKIINLHSPVAEYGIKIPGDKGEITVQHFMSHTSGEKPGTVFKYSERRFYFLEQLIYNASGLSFHKHLKDRIIKPLKLVNTASCTDRNTNSSKGAFKNLSIPYILSENMELKSVDYSNYFGVNDGLISSVSDLAVFSLALDNNVLISEQSKEIIWTNAELYHHKAAPCGLGWFVQFLNGIKVVWHHGEGYGFSSLIVKIPEKKLSCILLSNSQLLSASFKLESGNLMRSPFALSFLKNLL